MHHLVRAHHHVVAQVIEAELAVRAVGYVRPVGLVTLLGRHVGIDHPHGEPQEVVDGSHPGGVAPGQVVVHGHEVDALPLQGVEDDGQSCHQRLALASLHLGDVPVVQGHATDQLDVVMAQADRPPGHFAGQREDLRQELVQVRALPRVCAQLRSEGPQLLDAPGLHRVRQGVDVLNLRAVLPEGAVVGVQPQHLP